MAQFPWGHFALFTAGCKLDSSHFTYHHLTELIIVFFVGWLHPGLFLHSGTWYDSGVKSSKFSTFWRLYTFVMLEPRGFALYVCDCFGLFQWSPVMGVGYTLMKGSFLSEVSCCHPGNSEGFLLRARCLGLRWSYPASCIFSLCSDLEASSDPMPEFKSIYLCALSILHVWGSDSITATTPSEEQLYNVSWPSLLCLLLSLFSSLFLCRTSTLSFFPSLMPHGLEISTCKREAVYICKSDESPGNVDTPLFLSKKVKAVMNLSRLPQTFRSLCEFFTACFPLGIFIMWKSAKPYFRPLSFFPLPNH